METTACIHNERIESASNNKKHGTCTICGQVRQYNTLDYKEIPKVIKLGRINGVIVEPRVKDILLLPAEEQAELEAARKEGKLAPAISATSTTDFHEQPTQSGLKWYQAHKQEMIEDLITMENAAFKEKWKVKRQIVSHLKGDKLYKSRVATEVSTEMRTVKKTHKAQAPKCKSCEFYLVHDEQSWCTGERCKHRYPGAIRPPYRPAAVKQSNRKSERYEPRPDIQSVAEVLKKAKFQLPPFPEFNDSWPFIVQERWLEIYLKLRELELH